mgnify:CR=1 FL=1
MKDKNKETSTKKAKTILWISVSCFIIAIIVGVILFVLGGNTKINKSKAHDVIAEDIKNTFANTINEKKPFISEALETASVSVLSVTQTDKNTATAQCKVTSKNAYDAIKKTADVHGKKSTTVSALLEAYSKELQQSGCREETLDITLIKEDDKWSIDYSYELLNALMGGYLEYNYEAMELLETEEK